MNTLILSKKLKQQPRHEQRGTGSTNVTQVATTNPDRTVNNQPIGRGNNIVRDTAVINEQVQQLAQQLANQMVAEMQQSQILKAITVATLSLR